MDPVDDAIRSHHAALSLAERYGLAQWRLLNTPAQLRSQRAGDIALAIASAMNIRGAYREALPFAEHAVSVAREHHGFADDRTLHAVYWNVLVLGNVGRTADSILLLLEEAISHAQERHTDAERLRRLADLEELLGDVYCARGWFERARRIMTRALANQERIHGKHSAEDLQLLIRLASGIELSIGERESARARLAEAEAIIAAGSGTMWAESGRHHALMLRGHLARLDGQQAFALEAFGAALQVARQFNVTLDGRVIDATIHRAALLVELERYEDAAVLLQKFSHEVPLDRLRAGDLAKVLVLFVRAAVNTGIDAPLPELLHQAVMAMASDARSEFASADEGRRLRLAESLWTALREFLAIALSHLRHLLDANALAAIYELVIDFKGIVADAQCISRERRLAHFYPEAAADLARLADLRRTLQVTYGGTFQGGAPETEAEAVASRLRFEKAAIERALRPRIPDIDSSESTISVGDIAAAMAMDATPTLLVEFVRINYADSDKDSGFAVFLLPQGRPSLLRVLRLDHLHEIQREVARFRQALLGEIDPVALDAGAPDYAVIWMLLWQPIADAITHYRTTYDIDVQRLLIATDDVLGTLPFQVLRDPSWEAGVHLVDHYEISYLTNARDIAHAAAPARAGRPLAIGLGRFDVDADGTVHDGMSGSEQARGGFRPLTHSEDEARFVADRLGGEAWTGAAAVTKVRLLRRLGHLDGGREADYRSPGILHFATHGFSIRNDSTSGSPPARAPFRDPRAVLRQSGLALAGASAWANLVAKGHRPESHPSVLDAVDVSGLDLRDTVLAVLSSCESGAGALLAGEGVFGLQRAFLIAGAHGLAMALFPVGDASTIVLMEAFYDALAGGASPAAALRTAQRRVRRKYPWPACWAGIVTVGRSCILPLPLHK